MIALTGLTLVSVFIKIRNVSILGANTNQILRAGSNDLSSKKGQSDWSKTVRGDLDKDGLFDDEETLYRTDPINKDTDGDGFLDGEEIASGCSPVSASPSDCKLSRAGQSDKINLTKYFGSLIVGGVLNKDLDKSNPDFQNYVELLTQEASGIKKALLSIDDFEESEVSPENNPEKTSQEYLNSFEDVLIKYFLKENAGVKIDKIKNFDFSPYLNDLNILQEKLLELSPPPDWLDTHKEFLKFISKLEIYFTNLNNQKDDPIKALLTLDNTQSLLLEYDKLLEVLSTRVRKDNLRTVIFDL